MVTKIDTNLLAHMPGKVPTYLLLIMCLLIAGLFPIGNTAWATDYYLDAINGDDSYDGLSPEWDGTHGPWKTIAKAESSVANGSKVYLRSGNYGVVTISKTGLNRNSWNDGVTYMPDPNDPTAVPVFEKLNITGFAQRYLTFREINITSPSLLSVDWDALVLIRDSSHVKIIDCNLTGTWIPDGERLATRYYVRYGVFVDGLNNNIYDVLIDGCNIQGVSRGINFYHDIRDGMILRNCNIFLISESHILTNTNHNNGEIIIEGNLLYDRRMTPGAHGAGIALRDSRITVRSNIIHDYGGSGGIRLYGFPPVGYQISDILIENNLVYDAQGTSHMYFGEIGRNITVRNNTFIGWYGGNSGVTKYNTVVYFGPKADGSNIAENVFVYNNIFVGLVSVDSGIINFNENNNIFWAFKYQGNYLDNPLGTDSIIIHGSSGLNSGYDENYFEGSNNFFVGGALFDQYAFAPRAAGEAHKQNLNDAYQLAVTAVDAIDSADPAHATQKDLLGNTRDASPDIGCYEYISGTPDTTAPSVPQNLDATAASESQIDLSWDASTDPESGISYYKIYRDGAGTHIDTSFSTSYSDKGLKAGTLHSYQVSAVNGKNLESNKSNTDSATTSADTTPPTIKTVCVSETSITIVFSETIDSNSAENKDFYTIKNGSNDLSVMEASLSVDLTTVTLTTLPHVEGSYTLTVESVRDISGNTLVPLSIDYEYTNGLVGYWKFDEATGNTAFDSSGSGNNGTLVNGPTWTAGKIGSALLFDGTNNYVEIGAQDIPNPWAASFWVKRQDSSNSNAAMLDSPNYSLKLEQYPNLNKVGVTAYGVSDYVFNYEAPIDKWTHLVFVGTQTQVALYVDGNLADTIAASISCPMAQISSVSRATKGAIDEVRTYNQALNAAEVLELYNAGNSDQVTHTLDVTAVNGSVTKTPDKVSYNHGEEVTLQPLPDTGYTFVNWSGDLTGSSNPATIVMDADKTVTANFTITVSTYTLNITADNGSVTKTPDQATYDNGTTVTLQATANTGYSFAGWSGDASGTSNPTTVVMDGNKSVTANFTINKYTLGITAINGSVAKTPDQTSYNHGTTVNLQATANTGYSFAGWSGDASGTSNPTTVVMDGNKSVTANFTINKYTISASAGSNGQISPDGITQVNYGDSQAYTITADPGYKIYDVIVDGSSVGAVTSYSFTNVTANRTITANFNVDETDVTAPTVTNLSPQPDSIQVHLNTLITLDISDPSAGVDANSATIKVNNDTVYSGNTNKYSSAYGECYRTGTKADYTFIYQANERFNFDQNITVSVNARDLAGNSMEEFSYSFQTKMRAFGKNKKVNKNNNVHVVSVELASIINNDRPTTCSDSRGNIWTAWHAGLTGSRDIYIGKLTTGEEYFGDSRNLTGNSADQCNPAMAIGSDNKLYVAWQDNRRGNWDIYVSTSSDGINFSTERRVTDSNDNQINPAIVVDSSNNAYIVWQDDRNGNQDIYTAASNNGFVTKTISQITSDSSHQVDQAVAVDSENTVYVVWMDTRNGNNDIYGAASNNGPWTNIPVVTTEKSQSSPAIATESAGSILHLVWVDNTPGNNDIYYAKTTSGLPASPLIGSSIIDDTTGADQLQPAIVVSGSMGNNLMVFVCWKDERNADYDIYFAELGSGSGTNVFVDDDGTNTGQADPAIGIDGDGYPFLVWTDNRNSNTDIYYAGSTSIKSTALASGNISTSSTTTLETADGVSIVVPAGAYPCDIKITISEVKNPPKTNKEYLSLLYDFGPSGLEFEPPVTITIPYEVIASNYSASAYWYNLLTASPSQQGITDIETIMISSTPYLRFKTTHFTQFFVGGSSSSGGISVSGGSGGGGCSMSANARAGIVELILPYIGLTVTMVVLKLKDRRKRKAFNITKS